MQQLDPIDPAETFHSREGGQASIWFHLCATAVWGTGRGTENTGLEAELSQVRKLVGRGIGRNGGGKGDRFDRKGGRWSGSVANGNKSEMGKRIKQWGQMGALVHRRQETPVQTTKNNSGQRATPLPSMGRGGGRRGWGCGLFVNLGRAGAEG